MLFTLVYQIGSSGFECSHASLQNGIVQIHLTGLDHFKQSPDGALCLGEISFRRPGL